MYASAAADPDLLWPTSSECKNLEHELARCIAKQQIMYVVELAANKQLQTAGIGFCKRCWHNVVSQLAWPAELMSLHASTSHMGAQVCAVVSLLHQHTINLRLGLESGSKHVFLCVASLPC